MKTYLLSSIKRLKAYSQKLDAEAVLHERSWQIFNDVGDKETIFFRANKEILLSKNGRVERGRWELLNTTKILLDIDNQTLLFNTTYIEEQFLALQLDGTNEYMVMIDAEMLDNYAIESVQDVEGYLEDRARMIEKKEEIDKIEKVLKKRRNLLVFIIVLFVIYFALRNN